jgi:hypothetical protein
MLGFTMRLLSAAPPFDLGSGGGDHATVQVYLSPPWTGNHLYSDALPLEVRDPRDEDRVAVLQRLREEFVTPVLGNVEARIGVSGHGGASNAD